MARASSELPWGLLRALLADAEHGCGDGDDNHALKQSGGPKGATTKGQCCLKKCSAALGSFKQF
eukprot:814143-Alexandrium_andersonii.AAC.1